MSNEVLKRKDDRASGKCRAMPGPDPGDVAVVAADAEEQASFDRDVDTIRGLLASLAVSLWEACVRIGPIVAAYDEASGGARNPHDPRRKFSLRRLSAESGVTVTQLRTYRQVYERFGGLEQGERKRLGFSRAVALLKAPPAVQDALREEAESKNLSTREVAKVIRERYGEPALHEEDGSVLSPGTDDDVIEAETTTVDVEPGPASLANDLAGVEHFLDGVLDGEDLTEAGLALLADDGFMSETLARLNAIRARVGFLYGALRVARNRRGGMGMNG